MGVRWHVTFDSVIVLSPLSVRVMCESRGSAVWVFGDVHLRDYLQLNGLMPNTLFWISGHISKINAAEIYLKNVRLEFEG